ncbi:ABC transporter substrate-binding protein [Dysgonomonas sp. HGC4]|uniref:ABC transporter substrate-binding protein n=1 Tax=Dysgonomonas sp. HGC4 TaxID=1658009 RepID=UPI000680DD5D|nr:ABC transporter substrate-binding protein [Dysgonomonas sp. HGC4]MBD8348096.1 ABC transporter substrate-binding protein [Dysgonomonas sp. HGC4]
MRKNYLFLLLVFLITSCSGNKQSAEVEGNVVDTVYTVQYAKGFTVKKYADYKEVTVVDPWDSTKILQRYILVDKTKSLPANLPKGTLIRTPLKSIVAYSTIHCATLNELGVLATVKGVCEPSYIDIDYIQEGVKNGTIADLGQAANPIIEKIVDVDPEAIFATPIQGRTYGSIDKAGIPVIETPDYMEPLPLGRAEWIRFYSLFFDNESQADSLFNITVNNYNTIKEKMVSVKEKPSVFIDLMYGNVWYISGGGSFISRMLSDAGANYVWSDNDKVASTPLAFEEILDKAGDAQFWLIKYNHPTDLTYTSLEKEYKPYSYFSAFKNRNIYGCNAAEKSYYEDLPIHPDYILQDFAYIFHPDLFPDYTPRYYSKMKE